MVRGQSRTIIASLYILPSLRQAGDFLAILLKESDTMVGAAIFIILKAKFVLRKLVLTALES
jgi:hypothetical protein